MPRNRNTAAAVDISGKYVAITDEIAEAAVVFIGTENDEKEEKKDE